MKRFYTPVLLIALLVGSFSALAYKFPQQPEKKEISASKLPENARFDITDKYHGAKVLKVYRLFVNDKPTGYLITAQKGEKTWDVKYDNEGNPVNKINP